MKARVHVSLKAGVLDPEGKAIAQALDRLGFTGVEDVRKGKFFDLEISHTDRARAEADLTAMCEQLLANTVIESYAIEIAP
ncbi:MAG: phosphoribosylformylglycinamidine synthase subunit PurS [Alphaproteobacteria bacterium]